MGLGKRGVMSKYIIAVVFLLGLMQGKTEALDFTDSMVVIKEVGVISQKYTKCSETKDDKKRLACFDSLTIYIKEREKKYENLSRLDKLSGDSKKKSEKQLKNIVKKLDKALGLNNKPLTYSPDGSIRQSPDGKFRCVGFPKVRSWPECEKKFKEAKERTKRLFQSESGVRFPDK